MPVHSWTYGSIRKDGYRYNIRQHEHRSRDAARSQVSLARSKTADPPLPREHRRSECRPDRRSSRMSELRWSRSFDQQLSEAGGYPEETTGEPEDQLQRRGRIVLTACCFGGFLRPRLWHRKEYELQQCGECCCTSTSIDLSMQTIRQRSNEKCLGVSLYCSYHTAQN